MKPGLRLLALGRRWSGPGRGGATQYRIPGQGTYALDGTPEAQRTPRTTVSSGRRCTRVGSKR